MTASISGTTVAKPNYRFDKKQRELKKSQQQQEKLLKKLARKETPTADTGGAPALETTSPPEKPQ